MKRVDKIRIILLGPLAAYIVYVTLKESWTITDHIVMIVCLVVTLIDGSLIAAIRRRMRHEE